MLSVSDNGGIASVVGFLPGGLTAVCLADGAHNCKICSAACVACGICPEAGMLNRNGAGRFAAATVLPRLECSRHAELGDGSCCGPEATACASLCLPSAGGARLK